jgi:hypothetical protein
MLYAPVAPGKYDNKGHTSGDIGVSVSDPDSFNPGSRHFAESQIYRLLQDPDQTKVFEFFLNPKTSFMFSCFSGSRRSFLVNRELFKHVSYFFLFWGQF